MLRSIVPAGDSILPPIPIGNLALQPKHQVHAGRTVIPAGSARLSAAS
jgi:hypothetical protein